jgi:alkanesulfonate monooxygenase SsuD/methylene tetrahydromethanopterin reductase-like flavin-dependent oxidoreductase (luciferase family)
VLQNGAVPNDVPVGSQGLGVTAGLEPAVARELAARCADLGYASLWSNDEPTAPGLETLSQFATGAPQLQLGVGVLPLDRHPPAEIAAEIDRRALDPAKLWIGIGSGRLRPSLQPVREAVAELRDLVPAARIVVGAMRREMCRLGGEVADGVLLNWMLPAQGERARGWVHQGADAAGRTPPVTALYVRVAAGSDAAQRLRVEESRYRELDAAHFAAMDVPLGAVGVAAPDRPGVVAGLAPYFTAVDLPIVRALAGPDLASLVGVAEAAATR